MITEFYKNSTYLTQKITARTELAGKEYFWMRDLDGTDYLAKIDENGNPDFT